MTPERAEHDPLSCNAILLITGYGCGPNIIVGAPAALITGGIALYDKISQVWLQNQLEKSQNSGEREKIKLEIQKIEADKQGYIKYSKLFAWSTIPLAGPWIAALLMD